MHLPESLDVVDLFLARTSPKVFLYLKKVLLHGCDDVVSCLIFLLRMYKHMSRYRGLYAFFSLI